MRLYVAALLVALPLALAACGDETATSGDEPTPTPTASASTPTPAESPSPTGKPVSARRTCAELYHPPAQLMPRAIELVHDSPSGETADAAASELAGGLAEAEAHALGPLAEDIVVVRAQVEAVGAGEVPDLAAFDEAANGLGRNCEIYND